MRYVCVCVLTQVTGKAIKSPPLLVDTSDAIAMKPDSPPTDKILSASSIPLTSGSQPPSILSLANDDIILHDDDNNININNKKHRHSIGNSNTIDTSYQKDIITIEKEKNVLYYKNSRSAWLLNIYQNMKEIVLGICTALIVFLFILTMFCAYRGNKFSSSATKESALLQEEFSVHCES